MYLRMSFDQHSFSKFNHLIQASLYYNGRSHYNDVIMSTIASHTTSLTIVFTQSFIQMQIKENIKAPRHWPLCGEFTGDRWIPRTNGQLHGKCFRLMTSSCRRHTLWNYTSSLCCWWHAIILFLWEYHGHLVTNLWCFDQNVKCIIMFHTMFIDEISHNLPCLTHLPLDKMAAFSQTIFSDAFMWMKSFAFWFKFHWSLFLRV